MRKNLKKAVLLVDNPIHILVLVLHIVAIGVLINLYFLFLGSTQYPTLSSDCWTLIWKGSVGLIGILLAVLFLRTRKGKHAPIITLQFDSQDIFSIVYATACYMGIQVAVMVIRNMKIFQVAAVDVYAFYLATAIVEETLYRGALIMILQALLARVFKPNSESDALGMNLICVVISGSIFAGVHTHYYADPYLMTLTFLGGCSQAFWYLKTKNLIVVYVPHAVINWMAAGNIVQSLS